MLATIREKASGVPSVRTEILMPSHRDAGGGVG